MDATKYTTISQNDKTSHMKRVKKLVISYFNMSGDPEAGYIEIITDETYDNLMRLKLSDNICVNDTYLYQVISMKKETTRTEEVIFIDAEYTGNKIAAHITH